MRIVICTFTYPPHRDGVASACEAMARGLLNAGHEITVATGSHPSRNSNEVLQEGVTVLSFDAGSSDPARRAGEMARFEEWVKGVAVHLVVTHCWGTWTTKVLQGIESHLGKPLVLVSHGYAAHLVPWSRHFAWGLGAWLRSLPEVLCLARTIASFSWVTFLSDSGDFGRFFDLLVAKWSGFRRYSIVPNGISTSRMSVPGDRFRAAYGLRERVIFLCVANYSDRKNQMLAVSAYRRAALDETVLVLIGTEMGEYGRETQKHDRELARTDPKGRVLFLEDVSQEMIGSAYEACTIFVLPAKAETQPIVLLEAMAAARPWISTDTGCVRELPGGVVVSNESELTAAMGKLAADPQECARLGAAGLVAIRTKYSMDQYIAAYDALFRRWDTSGKGTPRRSD